MNLFIEQLHNLTFGLIALVISLTGQSAITATATTTATSTNGLYVLTNTLATSTSMAKKQIQALQNKNISGIVILLEWNELQPSSSEYRYEQLDFWATEAVRANKKISIGIKAGSSSPSWLSKDPYNVPFISASENTGDTTNINCVTRRIPIPWYARFKSRYSQAVTDLASHLKTLKISGYKTGAAYDAIAFVKVDGINVHTAELSLGNTQSVDTVCPGQTITDVWKANGYGPSKVTSAWGNIASSTDLAFPDKILSINILQRSVAFPLIDKDGNAIKATGSFDPVTQDIINAGLASYQKRFSVQWNALSTPDANPDIVYALQTLHASNSSMIGFQTNASNGNSGSLCGANTAGTKHTCTPTEYTAMLNNGINLGASFIEVWPNDVINYGSSTALDEPAARLRLLK